VITNDEVGCYDSPSTSEIDKAASQITYLLLGGYSHMDNWEFYTDASGDWRWRRIAPNGRIVGSASQGYSNKSDCEDNARRNGWLG